MRDEKAPKPSVAGHDFRQVLKTKLRLAWHELWHPATIHPPRSNTV